jgi:predicted MFS family arabinose efflux permease
MSQNTPSPEKPPWMAAFNSKVLTVGGEVGCITLAIVIASVFGGIWLDRVLGTRPLFTVGLVVLSAPLSLALTFWIARRATQDLQPPPASKQDDLNKEENSSE